ELAREVLVGRRADELDPRGRAAGAGRDREIGEQELIAARDRRRLVLEGAAGGGELGREVLDGPRPPPGPRRRGWEPHRRLDEERVLARAVADPGAELEPEARVGGEP